MSRTFSTKKGSVDSLKILLRWGRTEKVWIAAHGDPAALDFQPRPAAGGNA
jgi:hypothetical protein